MPLKMKYFKALGYLTLLLAGLTIVAYFSVTGYVNYQLEHRGKNHAYDLCQKTWSARGLYDSWAAQNSIESVRRALSAGAGGVEIDLRYDIDLKKFIISHDYPYNLKNGQLLSLKELFDAVGERGYYWLDYKNLRRLTPAQTDAAIARLKAISSYGDLRQRIYIEGADPISLPLYRQAGFNTIYDIHPPKDSLPITRFVMNIYKAAFYFGGHTVMAMAHGSVDAPIYGADTQASLGHIPTFLYHVPDDSALLKRLAANESVRVMLVGRDRSIDRFNGGRCTPTSRARGL